MAGLKAGFRAGALVLGGLAGALPVRAERADPPAERLVLFADDDDDDDDGVPDRSERTLTGAATRDLLPLPPGARVEGSLGSLLRLIAAGKPVAAAPARGSALSLQGLAPGVTSLRIDGAPFSVIVLQALLLDGRGARVDLATSHASVSRRLPSALGEGELETSDPDALRWVIVGPRDALPDAVSLTSTRLGGAPLDANAHAPLEPFACPAGVPPELGCRATPLGWATADTIPRREPAAAARWLTAEVGGKITLAVGDVKAGSIRVGGPRLTRVGSIERLRGRLKVHVLRAQRGGMPAIGGDDAGARALAQAEVDTASRLWGQCGIHFGPPAAQDISVVDPPPPYLLAVGCDTGLPASGGELRFMAGGRRIRVATRIGQSPVEVATAVARALSSAGIGASVSPNPATLGAPFGTADVITRRGDGSLAELKPDGVLPLSSDASLSACLGEVDLADGVEHFTDIDAPAGTVEERTLVKAFEDGDPTTIDVFIVPSFSGAGRIGESFVHEPGASIQNAVLLDRAGVRAGARSFVLAHELGHVLLDLPGHPDDFGVDRPSDLMDADAADPSMFGPRRLSIEQCERAYRQSGPGAAVPLLTPWPLTRSAGDVERTQERKRVRSR